jgi:hypothetical protein
MTQQFARCYRSWILGCNKRKIDEETIHEVGFEKHCSESSSDLNFFRSINLVFRVVEEEWMKTQSSLVDDLY